MSPLGHSNVANPIDPSSELDHASKTESLEKLVHPQHAPKQEDSAVTKAEKVERHGLLDDFQEPPLKRVRLDIASEQAGPIQSERQKGVAPIKAE